MGGAEERLTSERSSFEEESIQVNGKLRRLTVFSFFVGGVGAGSGLVAGKRGISFVNLIYVVTMVT